MFYPNLRNDFLHKKQQKKKNDWRFDDKITNLNFTKFLIIIHHDVKMYHLDMMKHLVSIFSFYCFFSFIFFISLRFGTIQPIRGHKEMKANERCSENGCRANGRIKSTWNGNNNKNMYKDRISRIGVLFFFFWNFRFWNNFFFLYWSKSLSKLFLFRLLFFWWWWWSIHRSSENKTKAKKEKKKNRF